MKVPPAIQNKPEDFHLQLLGGFTVQVGETTIPDAQWKSRRARSLLKLLALAPSHRLHRDQVIDALWSGADLAAAANSLHQTLFAARRVLDPLAPGCLTLDEGYLSLSGGEGQALWVDVDAFEAAATQAKKSQDPQMYQSALALYSGELLPEDRYEEWAVHRRETLQQIFLQLLLGLAQLQESLYDYPSGIDALQRLLAADPSHEEAHAGLMRLYALNGQRQQALRQYELLFKVLQSELDLEPSAATQALYKAIQSGRLDAATAASSPGSLQPQLPTGTVTFLFTDIEGSTTLWEQQPKAMKEAVARHHTLLREAIEAHGGVVFKVVGDQFQAAFRLAHQGLSAAVAAQQALVAERWPEAIGVLRVRMGLHTGSAELEGADYAVSHTLNRASRVMAAGFGWQVLLSQETASLAMRQLEAGVALKSLGEHRLKGLETFETLFQVVAPGLPQDFPNLPSALTRPHNLPTQLTSFIGREQEIAEVRRLVLAQRLVTLTGSGGTGKTRLALRAAEGLLDTFPDGVFFVELAPLSDPALVAQACAQTLELVFQPDTPIQEALAHYLAKKHLLLVLDNCEHVISACTRLVDSLLKACSRLHILATSREILSVPGEAGLRVSPLAVPDPRHLPPLDETSQYEAVRLFVERATQASPGIISTEGNAEAVVQICQRLDGIPLAIELAAARARLLTIEQIAERVGDAFRLLTGGSRAALPRHQTLKAMIDWSYEQLSPQERLLLQRLSVFAGGWTLEAAETVCADGDEDRACQAERVSSREVINLQAMLVDKSLVDVEFYEEGNARYRLLEIIRQYGRDRLVETGCTQAVRGRHLSYFADLSGQAEPHLRGKGQVAWLEQLDDELDNLRVALEWALEENVERGLQIMADLMWFWWIRSLFLEGAEWLDQLLKAEAAERGAEPLENGRALQRARGLRALSYLSGYIYFSSEGRRAIMEESVAILRRLGPSARRELGISLHFTMAVLRDLPPELSQEMLEIFRQENERFYLSEYLFEKNGPAISRGDMDQAEANLKESLAISREIEDFDGISSRLNNLGGISLQAGDYLRAETLFREGIEASRKVKNRWIEVNIHWNIMRIALAQGRYEDATRLCHPALIKFQEMGYRFGIAGILNNLLVIAWAQADYPQAVRLGHDLIEGYPEIPWIQMVTRFHLGRVALAQGDLAQAEAWIKQATSLWSPENGVFGVESILPVYAALFARQGRLSQATRLMGATDKLYQRRKMALPPRERDENAEAEAAARLALGEEAFAAAWEEGQAMTLEQARAYVLGEQDKEKL